MTPEEINAAVAVVKADAVRGEIALLENIDLREPTPDHYRAHRAGTPLPRQARVNVNHHDRPGVWQLIVSLADRTILSRRHFPMAHACFMVEQI